MRGRKTQVHSAVNVWRETGKWEDVGERFLVISMVVWRGRWSKEIPESGVSSSRSRSQSPSYRSRRAAEEEGSRSARNGGQGEEEAARARRRGSQELSWRVEGCHGCCSCYPSPPACPPPCPLTWSWWAGMDSQGPSSWLL